MLKDKKEMLLIDLVRGAIAAVIYMTHKHVINIYIFFYFCLLVRDIWSYFILHVGTNERICYRCKQTGHLSKECPMRVGGVSSDTSSSMVPESNFKKKKFGARVDDGGY